MVSNTAAAGWLDTVLSDLDAEPGCILSLRMVLERHGPEALHGLVVGMVTGRLAMPGIDPGDEWEEPEWLAELQALADSDDAPVVLIKHGLDTYIRRTLRQAKRWGTQTSLTWLAGGSKPNDRLLRALAARWLQGDVVLEWCGECILPVSTDGPGAAQELYWRATEGDGRVYVRWF